MLLAGDQIYGMSSSWEDRNAPWNLGGTTLYARRRAASTVWSTCLLTGWQVSHAGDRDEANYVVRMMEDWKTPNGVRSIRGSLVVGFQSVYGHRFNWGDVLRNFNEDGRSTMLYDYNLDVPSRQPPGAPIFVVTATAQHIE
jgi:hypothetical protein